MSFKPMWLLALLFAASGALAQTNNFNTLDRGGIQILCKSAVAVSAPADTNEDALATCAVPANAMGANGALRVTAIFSFTNNANAKALRIRHSGIGGTAYVNASGLTTQVNASFSIVIQNRGVTNSQICANLANYATGSTPGGGGGTGAVDTTAATTIVITGQKATGTDTLTLESFLVELMPSN